jgi:hypothetical protein
LVTKYFSLAIGIWPFFFFCIRSVQEKMAAKLSDLAAGFRPEISCPVYVYIYIITV